MRRENRSEFGWLRGKEEGLYIYSGKQNEKSQ